MTNLPTPEENKLPEDVPTYQPRRNLLDELPEFLKHPKNYMKVQRALLETMTCGKSHSDPSEMFHCKKCTENAYERRQLMKKLGFKSPAHYLAWKKTHEEVKKRVPLDMYNRLVEEKS